jgi:hypothetical protein
MARFETHVAPNCKTIGQAKMEQPWEQLDATRVLAWLAGALKLEPRKASIGYVAYWLVR